MPLLDAANQLECEKAKDVISDYIFEKLNSKNYLFYYKLTNWFNMKSLNNFFCNLLLQQYLLKEDVNSFYKLNLEELCQILSCVKLQISSELELFNAAVDWINYSSKERSKHMNALLKLIRLPLLSCETLKNAIKNHKFCIDCSNCKQIVDNALKTKSTNKASNIQFRNRHYSCEFETDQVMLVGGTKNSEDTRHAIVDTASLYTFDGTELMNPKKTSKMKEERGCCKVAAIGAKVYCFGGVDSSRRRLRSCEVYCRKSDCWRPTAPLPCSGDLACCVCSFMGKIYLFGDSSGGNWVYDPTEDDWEKVASCGAERNHAACAVFQGRCVVAGGASCSRHATESQALKSVEAFDHRLDRWLFLADMQTERLDPGAVAKGNKLFVINGFCESRCEVYDSVSKKFSFIASRGFRYSLELSCHPVIFGNNIVVLSRDVFNDDLVCKYDIEKNEWLESRSQLLKSKLPVNYSIVKLHNILE